MNMETIMQTLLLMGQGMLAIFVVIIAIYLVVLLLLKLTGRKKDQKDPS